MWRPPQQRRAVHLSASHRRGTSAPPKRGNDPHRHAMRDYGFEYRCLHLDQTKRIEKPARTAKRIGHKRESKAFTKEELPKTSNRRTPKKTIHGTDFLSIAPLAAPN